MANELRAKTVKKAPLMVDMNKIYSIESSNNPNAYNHNSGARGLGQVTSVGLADYNQLNPKAPYKQEQLFDPVVNSQVSNWTMNQRIPQMLNAYSIPDTVENRLIAYNWGIGNLRKMTQGQAQLPLETSNYIKKYAQGGTK